MRHKLFRGKPLVNQEYLDELETTMDKYFSDIAKLGGYKDGRAFGEVVFEGGKAWIVGEVIEATDEWITLEYWVPVSPITVGQYTGLKDKNGVKIFEGDIVRHMSIGRKITYIVAWDVGSGAFYYKPTKGTGGHRMFVNGSGFAPYEVIGNIYDNPEMLEVS